MNGSSRVFSGKVVLVTGGAVRIGRAIVEAFAKAGAQVVVHYRYSREPAEELVRSLEGSGRDGFCLQADLLDSSQRAGLIPAVLRRVGRLDVLVNNASVYRRSAMLELDEDSFKADWEINFMVPFQLMRQYARLVGSGLVINLLDQRVSQIDPGAGAYGLAKKMLRDATEATALEWAPAIRVNGVSPGLVLPPPGVAMEKMVPLLESVPMKCSSTVREVAEACLFLARTETVTGQIINVDGGMHLGQPGLS